MIIRELPLHQPARNPVRRLNKRDQGALGLGGVEALFVLGALQGHVPCGHVPADGEHFLGCQFEAPGEEEDDGFLSVADGEAGAVIDLIANVFLPVAVRVLAVEDAFFVDVTFAGVVQKGADGDAVKRELLLQFGPGLDDLFADH